MKILSGFILVSLCCICVASAVAQQKSTSLEIVGDIVVPMKFSLEQLAEIKSYPIQDLVITNHEGEPRGVAKNLWGFPVAQLFNQVQFDSPSPKQLSEFYLVFEATDGYKVVFSWNELFNNALGNEVFLVTSKEGEKLDQMDDALLLISHSDHRTGKRHVKNLARITVKRAD